MAKGNNKQSFSPKNRGYRFERNGYDLKTVNYCRSFVTTKKDIYIRATCQSYINKIYIMCPKQCHWHWRVMTAKTIIFMIHYTSIICV